MSSNPQIPRTQKSALIHVFIQLKMHTIEFGCSIDAEMFSLCIRFNSNFFRIKKKKLTWIKNNLEKTVYNAIKILVRCLISVLAGKAGPERGQSRMCFHSSYV